MSSWNLENAQTIADEFPYTFHKPSKDVIQLLQPGNEVKLIFEFISDNPDAPRAERMWVELTEIKGDVFIGQLSNDPFHITDLKYDNIIEFQECHIIDISIDDPTPSIVDKYIGRCFVTNNILHDSQSVGYLYREKPESDDDSGWRITTGFESDEYMENSNNTSYVSLGAVLSVDDSIIDLIDNEAGKAFLKAESGKFVEIKN